MSVLDATEAEAELGIQDSPPGEPELVYRKRKLGVLFWLSVVWLVLLLFGAFFADLLPLKDPNRTFSGVARNGPSADHWFGADNIGHDVFARTIYGARRSLAVSIIATVIGMLIGSALGLISGFYRKALDTTIMVFVNILLAIPALVLLLALVTFLAPPDKASPFRQTFWVTVSLSLLVIPSLARIVRGSTMVWSDRDFVMASRTLGARNKRIMFKEVLPNVVPAMFSFAFTLVAVLITAEAALAFFGVGDVSGVSWGLMIQNGRSQLERAPHMVLFPAIFMFLTILALNFIGDSVRTKFDVRQAGI
jgi:peptide/nickel transport system permease protein